MSGRIKESPKRLRNDGILNDAQNSKIEPEIDDFGIETDLEEEILGSDGFEESFEDTSEEVLDPDQRMYFEPDSISSIYSALSRKMMRKFNMEKKFNREVFSKEKELALAKDIHISEEKIDIDALFEFALLHIGWLQEVLFKSPQYLNNPSDQEDIYQESVIFLLRKAASFRPSEGNVFLTYFTKSFDGFLKNIWRSTHNDIGNAYSTLSLEAEIKDGSTLSDVVADSEAIPLEEAAIELDLINEVRNAIQQLHPKYSLAANILTLHFGIDCFPLNDSKICKTLGIKRNEFTKKFEEAKRLVAPYLIKFSNPNNSKSEPDNSNLKSQQQATKNLNEEREVDLDLKKPDFTHQKTEDVSPTNPDKKGKITFHT